MTVQLATRIDPRKKEILDKIHKKTHISIRNLTEKAIVLLDSYYENLNKIHTEESVNENFMNLVDYSMNKYDKVYKKLAE